MIPDNIKIIFVLEDFSTGGVERVSFQLLAAIKQFHPHIDIQVVYENSSGEFLKQYQALSPCNPIQGNKLFDRISFFSKKIINETIDLVVYTKGGLSKYRPLKSTKTKHIAIQHVPINLPETSWLKNTLRQAGAALLYRRLDKVVCVSKGIENNLAERLLLKKQTITTIYNPVLDEKISQLAAKPVKYNNYFVCVGRLHYQKGYDFLLNIVKEVKKTDANITVVIVGDGEDHKKLTLQIESFGLKDNIILHGLTTNPYKYIQNAKAILLPSRWEGLPTVLVEAAYLKIQIVSFDCRYGPKELTNNGDSGFLVEMGNIESFSEAIIKVFNGEMKPSPNIDSFTLNSAVKNYVELFESLLCKKS